MKTRSNTRVIPTLCPNCMAQCGINCHVEEGKLVKVTPLKGHVFDKPCFKAPVIMDSVYSKERITHPLKKIRGEWQRVSLPEALDTIADRLSEIKEKHGAKALAITTGLGMYMHGRLAPRFASVFGTPNYSSGMTQCGGSGVIAGAVTIGRDAVMLGADYEGSRCIVVWGTNPHNSDRPSALAIESARKKGSKLIVIDPRKTLLAKDADIFIQIRPGTDSALALSLINVIITEEMYDKDFVKDWTFGFKELSEHVKGYDPEAVEEITWVPSETIKKIARTYATNKPAVIATFASLEHCSSGIQYCRASRILMAITGNLDIRGGNVFYPGLRFNRVRVEGSPPIKEAVGTIRWPLFGEILGEDEGLSLPDAILHGTPYPIKAIVSQNCNPCQTFPNSYKVQKAFDKLEFVVVHDYYMTETAKTADIFLPAVHMVEQDVMFDYMMRFKPVIFLGRQVIEPPAECIEDWRLWIELSRRMGYSEHFPWQTVLEFYEYLLAPSGISVKDLIENPTGIWYMDPNKTQRYLGKGFLTPSGKVEIYSEAMKRLGYDPLPTYIESPESLVSRPDLAGKYPFIMLNGTREVEFRNSGLHNIPRLLKRMPKPLVEINSISAEKLGIADGDMVVIESLRGSIEMKAKVTNDIHPKVISLPRGWPGANSNYLSGDEDRDPVTGYCGYRTQLCSVRKSKP